MVSRILIANRGEIALRVLRACRTLGIEAVVAYSEADRHSLPAMLADEAICIGPADARRSYLSAPAIISAALVTGCDAIHPGYGFLCEDDAFADAVRAHGLTFIGPPAHVLERFASKEETRRLLAAHGLPTIPGSGLLVDEAQALEEAERVGYPVLVKPSAGGGGKGMRMVRSPRELAAVLPICRSEAKAGFGDDSLYLEKWLEDNRHVEVQVAVDRFGHGVHLWERDCSVQRRHQKILEESPSPAMTPAGRRELAERAIKAVVAAGYENVGTLEFLVDDDGNAYFIEINCRIQVEHPVTEVLTGIDLVATQIRIASGRAAGLHPGGRPAARPRHRVPDQRRGPGARLPARRRHDRAVQRAGRSRRPLRLPRLRRLRGPAVLRLAAGQAHRLGPHARGRDRPRAAPPSASWSSRASSPTPRSTGRCSPPSRSWTASSRRTCWTGSAAPRSSPARSARDGRARWPRHDGPRRDGPRQTARAMTTGIPRAAPLHRPPRSRRRAVRDTPPDPTWSRP